MPVSHADLLSILFYLNLPSHLLDDPGHECDFPNPLKVTQRNSSSSSLVTSVPSFRWCANTAAFLYRCSGLLYSPSHIRSVFERIFFEDCDGKLEKLYTKCQERTSAWRNEKERSHKQSEHCHVSHSRDDAKMTSFRKKHLLSVMSNSEEFRFSTAAGLLATTNAPLYINDHTNSKLLDIDRNHDNQGEVAVALEDPTSPRKRDRTSQEFAVSSFISSDTRVFGGLRTDAVAKTVDNTSSMSFGAVMHTPISTTEGGRSVGCEMSSVKNRSSSRRIGNVGDALGELRSSWHPDAASDMTRIYPPHQRIAQRDSSLRKEAEVGYNGNDTDDDEDEVWSFADHTPEQRARLYHLRYNTFLDPDVLSNILQEFFLVDNANVFLSPVPDETMMEYNEVRSRPYCDVIYAPQSLMQVKHEISVSRRQYYKFMQPLGLNSLRRHGSDIRHTRVMDRNAQEIGHESTQDNPLFVNKIREPKIAHPPQHSHYNQNEDANNDSSGTKRIKRSNTNLQIPRDTSKISIYSTNDYDDNSELTVSSPANRILSISELERAVWQIAANCVMFNAPQSYYPKAARDFAKSCSKILAQWCEEHMESFK